jgi:hypothetical protein
MIANAEAASALMIGHHRIKILPFLVGQASILEHLHLSDSTRTDR